MNIASVVLSTSLVVMGVGFATFTWIFSRYIEVRMTLDVRRIQWHKWMLIFIIVGLLLNGAVVVGEALTLLFAWSVFRPISVAIRLFYFVALAITPGILTIGIWWQNREIKIGY